MAVVPAPPVGPASYADKDLLTYMADSVNLRGITTPDLVSFLQFYQDLAGDFGAVPDCFPWSTPPDFPGSRNDYVRLELVYLDRLIANIIREFQRRDHIAQQPYSGSGPELLDTIKARVPVADVLEKYGCEVLYNHAKRLHFRCHLHGDGVDRTPAGTIDRDKNVWYCFGCNRGGSNLDAAMVYGGLTLRQAIVELAAGIGLEARPVVKKPVIVARGGASL